MTKEVAGDAGENLRSHEHEQAAGHAQMGFGCSPGELDTQGWWIISAGGMLYLWI